MSMACRLVVTSNFGFILFVNMNYCITDCRVCLKSGMIPIFGDERNPDISHEIETFGYICIKKDDNYPQFICEECLKLLQGAILFRETAKRSNNILKRRRVRGKKLKAVFQVSCIDGDNNSADRHDAKETQPKVSVSGSFSGSLKQEVIPMTVKVEVLTNSEREEGNVYSDNDSVDETTEILTHFNTGTGATTQNKECYLSSLTKIKGNVRSSNEERIKKCDSNDNTCNICCKSLSKIYYPVHMKKLHDIIVEKPVVNDNINKEECPECKKIFVQGRLRRHMKYIHDKIQPLIKVECPVCKKMISRDFLPIHEKRHKEGKKRNLVCEQCGKNFHFHSSLSMHKLIHKTELPFKCSYCPYKGRTKDVLKIHVRTHTKEYPYVCAECGISFINKSNLNVHMKRHKGPIDFKCDSCPRGFYSKLELERHITVAHEGVKSHICADCGAAFGYSRGLRKHQVKVHKRPKGSGKPKAVYLKMEEESAKDPNSEV